MKTSTNGIHSQLSASEAADYNQANQNSSNPNYATGAVSQEYPYSRIAALLDSPLAHRTVKYGVETLTFAVINIFFPKRTSWIARVALPLAVNYVLGKWIEDNYDTWVATLAHREQRRKDQQTLPETITPATT